MGISKSRMKKVAPVSVTEETVCSSDIQRDESQLFGPSNTKASYLRVSIRRAQADCNSEGQDSEVLAEEVDRILAECDTDTSLNRTSYKMSMFGSKSLGLYYYAKGQDCNSAYSGSTRDKNEINTVNILTSIHEKIRPPQDLLNIESTATALGSGTSSGSSVALPIIYDASEEDLMNTIEREFG